MEIATGDHHHCKSSFLAFHFRGRTNKQKISTQTHTREHKNKQNKTKRKHTRSQGKVCLRAKWPVRPELIRSMKRLGVFLLPFGWDASPSQGYLH